MYIWSLMLSFLRLEACISPFSDLYFLKILLASLLCKFYIGISSVMDVLFAFFFSLTLSF